MRILPWKPTDLENRIQIPKIPTFLFLSICNDKEQSALGIQWLFINVIWKFTNPHNLTLRIEGFLMVTRVELLSHGLGRI